MARSSLVVDALSMVVVDGNALFPVGVAGNGDAATLFTLTYCNEMNGFVHKMALTLNK